MFKRNKQADRELFAVYDSKTESYTDIIPAVNHLDVLREFTDAFSHPDAKSKNRYYRNAEDFSLFKVGTYSLKTAEIEPITPTHIVSFHELRSQVERMNSRPQEGALLPT